MPNRPDESFITCTVSAAGRLMRPLVQYCCTTCAMLRQIPSSPQRADCHSIVRRNAVCGGTSSQNAGVWRLNSRQLRMYVLTAMLPTTDMLPLARCCCW